MLFISSTFTFVDVSDLVIFPPDCGGRGCVQNVVEAIRRVDLRDLNLLRITEKCSHDCFRKQNGSLRNDSAG